VLDKGDVNPFVIPDVIAVDIFAVVNADDVIVDADVVADTDIVVKDELKLDGKNVEVERVKLFELILNKHTKIKYKQYIFDTLSHLNQK